MVKSPNRKSSNWHGVGIKEFQLSETDFKDIERQSNIALTKDCKKEINVAINKRRLDMGREKNAPTRQEVYEEFKKALKYLEFLRGFFGEEMGVKPIRKRAIDSALFIVMIQNNIKFNFENFSGNLALAHYLVQSADTSFSNESTADTGGAKKDTFVEKLVYIYGKNKSRGKPDKFLEVINKKLPNGLQFSIPSNMALSKRKQRLKGKKKDIT